MLKPERIREISGIPAPSLFLLLLLFLLLPDREQEKEQGSPKSVIIRNNAIVKICTEIMDRAELGTVPGVHMDRKQPFSAPKGAMSAIILEMTMRKNISSGSPMEKPIGFSRAVRIGNIIAVSGTAPIASDGTTAFPGDLYQQTKHCIGIMKKAIEEAGGSLENVIRTRIMLTDTSQWEAAARAHGEFFSEIRPACTFAGVRGFIRSDWLVETEADCILSDER